MGQNSLSAAQAQNVKGPQQPALLSLGPHFIVRVIGKSGTQCASRCCSFSDTTRCGLCLHHDAPAAHQVRQLTFHNSKARACKRERRVWMMMKAPVFCISHVFAQLHH